MIVLPSWTYLILISLYHVLRLCHSFKVWSLPPSLQFYHQRVFILDCLLNRGHPYPHLDMCPSPSRYVWSIPLRVHFSPCLFKAVLGSHTGQVLLKAPRTLIACFPYISTSNYTTYTESFSQDLRAEDKARHALNQSVSQVRCLTGGIGITWESVRKKIIGHVPDLWSRTLQMGSAICQPQILNPILLHCRQILYRLSHHGSPILMYTKFKNHWNKLYLLPQIKCISVFSLF